MRLLELKNKAKVVVVYGGGFQPFHQGHMSSYLQAKQKFPGADFYVAASNDTKTRPIPFDAKQFLAQQAGVVDPFVQVSQPINPREILANYNPEQDILVLVRSERDPMSYTKKDGTPGYYQPFVSVDQCEPFSKHGYILVTKKHVFDVNGEEVYSGSQVRTMYAEADDAGKANIIKQLYPKARDQKRIKQVFDQYLSQQGVAEGSDFFAGSKFADEDGNTFSVEKIIAFAKKNPKYFHKDFPLSKIKHDLSWWQGNKERMMNADTSFPLLVIQNDDGHLGVADGLNRMKKAVDVEKKTTIDVYLVPKKDIMKFSEKQGVAEGLNEFAMSGSDDDEDDKYTPQDFGKPFKANYLGQNKFEVFCRKPQDPSNVIKLNAEVQKYGLEWEENFGFWFLDSPGAVYLSWKYGEIPLPKAIDQARNPGHIHDLVTDYLTNSPHAAEIQKIATEYFGFTMDGDMNEGLNEFAISDDGEDPTDNYPCYDCGSTIFLHHTKLCELAEDNAIRDLPAQPGSQHWTGEIPKGLHPIPGLQEGVAEAKKKRKKKSSRSTRGYFFPGYAYYGGSGESGDGEGVEEGSNKKQEATRRIQKMLNDKFGANLDVDGILGPLTLKSINKFMPNAKVGPAKDPNKTTAVQGKKVKNEDIDQNQLAEKWSQKYKSSINCSDPKGFSQRAHCDGKNKNEDILETAGYNYSNINDDDWYEFDSEGNVVRQSGPRRYELPFGSNKTIKLPNGNIAAKGMTAKRLKLFKNLSESREYYTVMCTDAKSLRQDFNMSKDRHGWFLKEGSTPKQKLDVYRAFGSPKLKEYDLSAFSGGTQTKGEDNVISPVGSQTRAQYKK